MARILTDGAEMGDILTMISYGGTSVNPTVSSTTKRSGGFSYQLGWGSWFISLLSADATEIYMRMAWNLPAQATTAIYVEWRHGSTAIGGVRSNSNGTFSAYAGTTSVATGTAVHSISSWFVLEARYKIVNSASGIIQTKYNGLLDINYTGDTQPGSDTHVDRVYIAHTPNSVSYLDDMAINDASGSYNNSWCGTGKIIKLTPNGNGTHNNWVGSDGNSTDNYLLVDDFANDGDTTYVTSPSTSTGTQDQYALSNCGLTNPVVNCVMIDSRSRKGGNDDGTMKLGILPSGGTDQMSSARSLTTSYSPIQGDVIDVNPVDSLPFEAADLDALEAVIEVG